MTGNQVLGCLDEAATNWNPLATVSDNSCDYTSEVVKGYFRANSGALGYISDIDGETPAAASLQECVEIAKAQNAEKGTGITVAGFRGSGHGAHPNTCYFYKYYDQSYDRAANVNDVNHTMTCVHFSKNFEECARYST